LDVLLGTNVRDKFGKEKKMKGGDGMIEGVFWAFLLVGGGWVRFFVADRKAFHG
jgi:hypothetical protein